MKRLFRMVGWALFICFSFLLLLDYSGIEQYDTCLFSLNGQSVGLQGANVFNLSPKIMGIIYFILLVVNFISAIRKMDYYIVTITNIILAIPVFLVLNPFALSYPPFGRTESFVFSIFGLLMFSYLSTLLLIGLVVWRFVNIISRIKDDTREYKIVSK